LLKKDLLALTGGALYSCLGSCSRRRRLLPSQSNPSKSFDADADAILSHLTSRQHLQPQATVQGVLDDSVKLFGCCPKAIGRGMQWLGIDSDMKIGRLRRSELIQLARAVHRFWMQNIEAAASDAK
jgi:hypothetical protein